MEIPIYHLQNRDSSSPNIHNGYLKIGIDRKIRFTITHPDVTKYKGTVVILESYTSAIEKYFLPMNEISKRGFYTAIFDWFDHEKSQLNTIKQNKHNYFDINNNINKLDKFLKNIVYNNCPPPYYILAYDIGGLIALSGVSLINHKFSRMLCVSPLFAPFGYKTNSFQHKLTQFFSDIGLGFLPIKGEKKLKQKNTKFYPTDKTSFSSSIFNPSPTYQWMASILNTIDVMKKNITNGQLQIPTLFILADKNNIVNNIEVRKLCQHTHLTDSITIIGAALDTIMHKEHHKKQFWAAFDVFISNDKPTA
ncbi:serine aminopeptidase domain-containing protein [Bartonella sp. B10]